MATLFTGRRKPKVISRREKEGGSDENDEEDTGPVVRRPNANLPKNKSKLRVSFNPGGDGDDDTETSYDTVGKTSLQQPSHTLNRSTSQLRQPRHGLSSAAAQALQNRSIDRTADDDNEDGDNSASANRPSYNKAYLDELRNSTPSTPRDVSVSRDDSPSLDFIDTNHSTSTRTNLALDLESKFGKTISSSSSSRIPSLAEIREKKDRRARLAKEEAANALSTHDSSNSDFVSLEDYDSDGEFKPRRMQLGSYDPATANLYQEKNTRLIHEDEDIAEGFDSFVEDAGRVTLSRRGLKEQTQRDREAIRTLIEEAEGRPSASHKHARIISDQDSNPDYPDDDDSNDNSDSDSDYTLHQAYELSQTHHGMDGLKSHGTHTRQANRPRQPRETSSIPKLSVGLARLREMVSKLEFERARLEKRRADIAREKIDVKDAQAHIQKSLEEAGKELESVTATVTAKGVAAAGAGDAEKQQQVYNSASTSNGLLGIQSQNAVLPERGLESLGSTPEHVS